MSTPKISIIIPCYNVEPYVGRCLESIKNQTFSDFEAFVINDKSTDNTLDIIKKTIGNDSRFIIIDNPENLGLSNARNIAMQMAEGEYLSFVDGDDFVTPDYLETLYNLCEENDAEISVCNFYYHYPETKKSEVKPKCLGDGVFFPDEVLHLNFIDKRVQNYVWNKLYKRSLFTENSISFPNYCFEDISVIPLLFFFSTHIASTSKPLYYYIQRQGSIINMNRLSLDKVDGLMNSVSFTTAFFNRNGNKKNIHDLKYLHKRFKLAAQYFTWICCKDNKKYKDGFRKLIEIEQNFKYMKKQTTPYNLPYKVSDD